MLKFRFGNVLASAILLSAPIVLALVASGWKGSAFAQIAPQTEICNGKDDNGDGVIDEGVNCDHYLSYLLDKSINPISVVLRDQFISPTDFKLILIERLLNPVRKLHAGIALNPRRPELHYLAYQVQSQATFTPKTVLIQNQFEQRPIVVTKPRYLLTPTGKKKIGIPIDKLPPNAEEKVISSLVPPVPQNANHYLCWDIEPYELAKGVTLRDQFQQKQFEVIRARYLCNPVEKTHNGKVHQIVDEKNHLVCYEVIPHNTVNRNVLTHDQFGVKSLKAVRTEEICVPTVKTLLPAECIPAPEVCDGIDNDCDESTDEGLGQTTCGVGVCQRTVNSCVAGEPHQCVPGVGSSETCNNLDDDCDGAVDEGIPSTPTSCGTGACQANGTSSCVNGVFVNSCTPGPSSPETCNGVDDDCDGSTDEGLICQQ